MQFVVIIRINAYYGKRNRCHHRLYRRLAAMPFIAILAWKLTVPVFDNNCLTSRRTKVPNSQTARTRPRRSHCTLCFCSRRIYLKQLASVHSPFGHLVISNDSHPLYCCQRIKLPQYMLSIITICCREHEEHYDIGISYTNQCTSCNIR